MKKLNVTLMEKHRGVDLSLERAGWGGVGEGGRREMDAGSLLFQRRLVSGCNLMRDSEPKAPSQAFPKFFGHGNYER